MAEVWTWSDGKWQLMGTVTAPSLSVGVAGENKGQYSADTLRLECEWPSTIPMTITYMDKAHMWWVLTQSRGRAIMEAILEDWARWQCRDN